MAPRVSRHCYVLPLADNLAIVSPADDPGAVLGRGTATLLPDDVHDLPTLAGRLSSFFTLPVGSRFSILGKFGEEDPAPLWLPFEGALPDAKYLYVRVVLPSADSVALTNILQKLNTLRIEVSKTRSATDINADDFQLVVNALKIYGPISEDIQGNVVEDEKILEALLGDERFWDERYEEQQRERYSKVVQGWLVDRKSRRIKWVNGNKVTVQRRFEGLHFDLSSTNDVIAMSRTFGELVGQGALLGVEMKRKRLTKMSLLQAMVEFFLWADASCFPFVQVITDMQKGGVAFYCKAIDARRGIEMRRVILKKMEEVREFVSQVWSGFPDDLGGDTPDGLIIPETLAYPPKKKFKQMEKPDEASPSRQQTGLERATKGQIALWTIGARMLENEGDIANLADVMDLDPFQLGEGY